MTRIEHLAALLDNKTIAFTKLADDTGIVLDTNTAQVMSLNESATFLIEAMSSGARTGDELVHALLTEFEVDGDTARADVEAFLEDLSEHVGNLREGSP